MTEEPLFDGPISRVLGILRNDISALDNAVARIKGLDESIIELQHVLAAIVNATIEGLVLVQDFKIIWASATACDMLGYPLMELQTAPIVNLLVPDQRDKARALTNMLLAGAEIKQPVEWTILRKDRIVSHVKTFGFRIKFQDKPALFIVLHDITEEIKMRDELQLRALLLDSVSDSVFLCDRKGKIVYVNEAAYMTRGYGKTELLGKNILDITPDAFRRKAVIMMRQFSEHKSTRFRTAHICADGSSVSIEVNARAICIGKKTHYLGVAREKHKPEELDLE